MARRQTHSRRELTHPLMPKQTQSRFSSNLQPKLSSAQFPGKNNQPDLAEHSGQAKSSETTSALQRWLDKGGLQAKLAISPPSDRGDSRAQPMLQRMSLPARATAQQHDGQQHDGVIQRQIITSKGETIYKQDAILWLKQKLKSEFEVDNQQLETLIKPYLTSGQHPITQVLLAVRQKLRAAANDNQPNQPNQPNIPEIPEQLDAESENEPINEAQPNIPEIPEQPKIPIENKSLEQVTQDEAIAYLIENGIKQIVARIVVASHYNAGDRDDYSLKQLLNLGKLSSKVGQSQVGKNRYGTNTLTGQEAKDYLEQRNDSAIDGLKPSQDTRTVTQYDDNFLTNIVVASGHGVYAPKILADPRINQPAKITVPSGTTFTMWEPHGAQMKSSMGQQIDLANNFTNIVKFYKQLGKQLYVYQAGDEVFNYHLTPGAGLTINNVGSAKLFTPDRPYTLAELLTKFRGRNLHWSACADIKEEMTVENLYQGKDSTMTLASEATEVDPSVFGKEYHDENNNPKISPSRLKYLIEIAFAPATNIDENVDNNKSNEWMEFQKNTFNADSNVTGIENAESKIKTKNTEQLLSTQEEGYVESFGVGGISPLLKPKQKQVAEVLQKRMDSWKKLLDRLFSERLDVWKTLNVEQMMMGGDRQTVYEQLKATCGTWDEYSAVAKADKEWSNQPTEYKSKIHNSFIAKMDTMHQPFNVAAHVYLNAEAKEQKWKTLIVYAMENYPESLALVKNVPNNTWNFYSSRLDVIETIYQHYDQKRKTEKDQSSKSQLLDFVRDYIFKLRQSEKAYKKAVTGKSVNFLQAISKIYPEPPPTQIDWKAVEHLVALANVDPVQRDNAKALLESKEQAWDSVITEVRDYYEDLLQPLQNVGDWSWGEDRTEALKLLQGHNEFASSEQDLINKVIEQEKRWKLLSKILQDAGIQAMIKLRDSQGWSFEWVDDSPIGLPYGASGW